MNSAKFLKKEVMLMSGFWETQEGHETGAAIRELANATKRSKATKYDAPMQVKTFVFKYDFNMDKGTIPKADNCFIIINTVTFFIFLHRSDYE